VVNEANHHHVEQKKHEISVHTAELIAPANVTYVPLRRENYMVQPSGTPETK